MPEPCPADDLLLPEDVRLIHIGPQKTGSTALQAAVESKREELREHGVTAVGTARPERQALWAALMHPGSSDERYVRDFRRWDSMAKEVDRADGRVLVTNESLGKADADGARRMVAALGGSRAHVVAVARRLDRLLPSQWQQRVKMNATTLSYEAWLEVVLAPPGDRTDPVWANIWVPHDLRQLADRWTGAASLDRFTFVVADESDRSALSRTVERMLGLPAGILRPEESHKSNQSLAFGRLELIRHLNERLRSSDLPEEVIDRVQPPHTAARRVINRSARLPGEQNVPPMPEWARERVQEMSVERAELIGTLGVRVIGNPDHLRMPEEQASATDANPGTVPSALAADAIWEAIERAQDLERELLRAHERELSRLRRKVRRQRRAANGVNDASAGELTAELAARVRRRVSRRDRG